MLKYVLLATTLTISTPAVGQQASPAQSGAMTHDRAMQTTPAPMSAQTTTPAATTPAAGSQVASVIDNEFGAYDKDASGSLSAVEFAAWMNALKAKAEPAAKPDAKYNAAAFKQADKDKSRSVDKQELASFLGGTDAAAS